jgi:hypothetical protein
MSGSQTAADDSSSSSSSSSNGAAEPTGMESYDDVQLKKQAWPRAGLVKDSNRVKRSEQLDGLRLDAQRFCKEEVKAFAQCMTGRTVSVLWACHGPNGGMKRCISGRMQENGAMELLKKK